MAVVARPQWAVQGSFWDTQAAASPFHCPVGLVWWSQGPVQFRNSFSQIQFSAFIGTIFSSEARVSYTGGARSEQIKSTDPPQSYLVVLSSVCGHICPASIARCGRFETPPESEKREYAHDPA